VCAAICGAGSWTDVERFGNEKLDWFRTFLCLEHGIPSHDTFGREFSLLDTGEFYSCLASWIASLQLDLKGKTVAIDGKTLRGKRLRAGWNNETLHAILTGTPA